MTDPEVRMTDQEVKEANKSYLGLTDKQYDFHDKLMALRMNQWPQGLKNYLDQQTNRVGGVSGDGLACLVADWIKTLRDL